MVIPGSGTAVASRNVALLLSVLAAALGAAALAGWVLDIAFLKSVLPGGVTMKVNTALGMLLTGFALALLARETAGSATRLFALVLACWTVTMGFLTLAETFFALDLHIDQWLFVEARGAVESTSPGRMSPPAAFCFVLTGVALALASRRFAMPIRAPVVSAVGVTVMLVGGLGLFGHLLFAALNIRFWNYAGLAPHTAAGFLLLGCALLAWVRSEGGLPWATDRLTTTGFAVGVLSIIAAAGMSYGFTDQLREDARLVAHSQEALKEIQELNTSQRDLTLSLGRYVIAHDASALAERPRIKAAIQEDTDHVRRLTAGDLPQQNRLNQLERVTARRIALSDQIIDAVRRKSASNESPLGTEYPAAGLQIERLLKDMETDEYALLEQRLARSEASATRAFLLMPVGAYLSLAMLLLGLFFLDRRTAERERSRAALAEKEAELGLIFDNVTEAIVTVDERQRVVLFNSAAEKMFGYTATAMTGQPLDRLLPARHRAAHAGHIESFGRSGQTRRAMIGATTVYGLHADGREFPLEASISQIEVAGRKVYTAVLRDITQRLEANRVQAQLAAIVESSEDAIIGKDIRGVIASWNKGAEKTFGFSQEEMVGRPLLVLLPPDRLHEEEHILERIRAGESVEHFETIRRRKDGAMIDVSVSVSPIRDATGGVVGASKIARDITERKRAEHRIRRLNRLYAILSGINTLIVRTRDREELFREACRIAVDLGAFKMAWIETLDPETLDGRVVAWYGGEEDYVEKIGLTARGGAPYSEQPACRALRLIEPVICNDISTDPSVAPIREELLSRGYKSIGCFPLTLDGRAEAVLALFAGETGAFDDEEMRLLVEAAGDISFALHHIRQSEHLDYVAYYDELTGLANRTLFRERVGQFVGTAERENKKLAVAMLNIERFRTINDGLGRQAGDELLRQIAGRGKKIVADASWLARLGGDHFAAVLPDMIEADEVARRLSVRYNEIFGAPFTLQGKELRVAARFGIAVYPADGLDADTLLRNAEAALKKAKTAGERYLFYTEQMTERVAERLNLENNLRRALENDEFVLHYQPKVSLDDGRLSGVEALIRWNDPATGLVPPAQFIPLLEETGLILEVGNWALQRAVLDHRHWLDLGLAAPRIAVNVSPLQLRRSNFVDIVWQAVASNASTAGIDLEITESLIMEDVEGNIAKLKAIREMGITIYIDDFGTGYSSLGYLAKLPVQVLKIDRSFVITMLEDPNVMTLVSTIVSLAHSLKLSVVAEGIEKEEQAQMLRKLRCEEGQGYLFSKPVPRDELTALLRNSA